MSARFATAAARLAGISGALCGWRPDEFWRATPAELATLLRTLVGDGEVGIDSYDIKRLQELFPDG